MSKGQTERESHEGQRDREREKVRAHVSCPKQGSSLPETGLRERERILRRLHAQSGGPTQGSIPRPWDHDLG